MNSSHADTDGHVTALIRSRQTLQADPENAAAFFEQGIALCQLGQWEGAIAAWQQSVRLQADNVFAHLNIGIVLLQHARWEEAEEAFEAAARCQPDSPEAHYGLGVAYAQQMRYDDAHAAWQETLRLDPTHEEAHANLTALIQMMTTEVASLNISELPPVQMDCVVASRVSRVPFTSEGARSELNEESCLSSVSAHALSASAEGEIAPSEKARIKLPPFSGPPLGEIAGAVFAAHDARASNADGDDPATSESLFNKTLRLDSKELKREHARLQRRENSPWNWSRSLAVTGGAVVAAIVLTLWASERLRAPVATGAAAGTAIPAQGSSRTRLAASRVQQTSFEAPVAIEPVPTGAPHSGSVSGRSARAAAPAFHTHRTHRESHAERETPPVRERHSRRQAAAEAETEHPAKHTARVVARTDSGAPAPAAKVVKSAKHTQSWGEDTFAAHHKSSHNDGADEWTDHLP